MSFEILGFLIGVVVLAIPLAIFGLALVAFVRSRRISELEERIQRLESRLAADMDSANVALPRADTEPRGTEETPVEAEIVSGTRLPQRPHRPPIQWEMLIGQKAFGWIAVVLGIFAAAFFLKYAYDNNWIGPVGRVAIGVFAGASLLVAGHRYFQHQWRVFSQMLTACGTVVLYLSAYSAFGFYHLLPSWQAGSFLVAIVVLSMLAAILYDSLAVALMAVLGGLLAPLLLHSERDTYVALFTYLGALNVGVALVTLRRPWPVIGSLALLGTQGLYWSWYAANYHPEKFGWALGFQALVYGLYVTQDVAVQLGARDGNRWEAAARMLACAALWFAAFFALMSYDYRVWMGVAAVVMATVYALIARLLLSRRLRVTMESVTAIAIGAGFVVLAIPLEADARWVALPWAATAAVLWWFGLRIQMPALRVLAAAVMLGSVARTLFVDLPSYPREQLWPVLNQVALPSIGVTVCLSLAVLLSRPYRERLGKPQCALIATGGLAAIILLWLVLTIDLAHFFRMKARFDAQQAARWRWVGAMSVSILWTVYASVLLAMGFRFRLAALRWVAIVFFGITIGKVFLFDMSELSEIYRIMAFFVLSGLSRYCG